MCDGHLVITRKEIMNYDSGRSNYTIGCSAFVLGMVDDYWWSIYAAVEEPRHTELVGLARPHGLLEAADLN
jgi:hypothetical protein